MKDKFGLSKLSFEDFIFEEMTLLTELQKKQCMQNLGYENNTYPYLSRFIGVSFYFGQSNSNEKDNIKVIPRNNLLDTNMDKFVNIRILEKSISQFKDMEFGVPKRIYYPSPGWYNIEGVYMKKNLMGKNDKKIYNFDKDIYKGKNVFFSTNSYNITAMAHSGKIKFLLYVVADVLKRKDKKNQDNDDDSLNSSEEKKESENSNEEEEIKSKEVEKSSMYSKSNNDE